MPQMSDLCLEERGINLRDHLAGFDLRIKIDKQLSDIPRDLAAHLHVDDGIERAGRSHCLCNRAARDRCSLIVCTATVAALAYHRGDNEQHDDECDPR